jgi:hypothetical protein
MSNIRQKCRIIMNNACRQMSGGLSLDDLPDLPCVMNALDEMEEYIESEGESALTSELYNIAQEAVAELLEEEGFEV